MRHERITRIISFRVLSNKEKALRRPNGDSETASNPFQSSVHLSGRLLFRIMRIAAAVSDRWGRYFGNLSLYCLCNLDLLPVTFQLFNNSTVPAKPPRGVLHLPSVHQPEPSTGAMKNHRCEKPEDSFSEGSLFSQLCFWLKIDLKLYGVVNLRNTEMED